MSYFIIQTQCLFIFLLIQLLKNLFILCELGTKWNHLI